MEKSEITKSKAATLHSSVFPPNSLLGEESEVLCCCYLQLCLESINGIVVRTGSEDLIDNYINFLKVRK